MIKSVKVLAVLCMVIMFHAQVFGASDGGSRQNIGHGVLCKVALETAANYKRRNITLNENVWDVRAECQKLQVALVLARRDAAVQDQVVPLEDYEAVVRERNEARRGWNKAAENAKRLSQAACREHDDRKYAERCLEQHLESVKAFEEDVNQWYVAQEKEVAALRAALEHSEKTVASLQWQNQYEHSNNRFVSGEKRKRDYRDDDERASKRSRLNERDVRGAVGGRRAKW